MQMVQVLLHFAYLPSLTLILTLLVHYVIVSDLRSLLLRRNLIGLLQSSDCSLPLIHCLRHQHHLPCFLVILVSLILLLLLLHLHYLLDYFLLNHAMLFIIVHEPQ